MMDPFPLLSSEHPHRRPQCWSSSGTGHLAQTSAVLIRKRPPWIGHQLPSLLSKRNRRFGRPRRQRCFSTMTRASASSHRITAARTSSFTSLQCRADRYETARMSAMSWVRIVRPENPRPRTSSRPDLERGRGRSLRSPRSHRNEERDPVHRYLPIRRTQQMVRGMRANSRGNQRLAQAYGIPPNCPFQRVEALNRWHFIRQSTVS